MEGGEKLPPDLDGEDDDIIEGRNSRYNHHQSSNHMADKDTVQVKNEHHDDSLEARLSRDDEYFSQDKNDMIFMDSEEEFEARRRKSHKKKVFYDPAEYGPDDVFCRKCFKPFVSLRGLWSHVTQLKPCRKFYGEKAILEMRENLSALPPVSPSTQALRIAQQREKSRDYFEKHRLEILKKRKEMFNASLEKGADEALLQEELEMSHCKHCYKPFKNLRGLWSHIAQMIPCRKFYGEDALAEMKDKLAELYGNPSNSSKKRKTKKKKKKYKSATPDEDNDDQAESETELGQEEKALGQDEEESLESKAQKQREFYEKNRDLMLERQNRYNQHRKEAKKERQSNYYKKNRMEIRDKRMQHYQENKTKLSGIDLCDSLFSKKFLPVPDPEKAHGILNIPQGPDDEDVKDDKPFWSQEKQTSPLGICTPEEELPPGSSKIDHESATELVTMPIDSKLSSLILSADDCEFVDSFVGMTLSNDGESVEIKYLLRRENITLEGLRDLLHSVLCVLDVDLFNFVSEKTSPVLLHPPEQLPLLRNRYTKAILACNKEKPSTLDPLCRAPVKNFESYFISDEMLEDVPYHQLLLNPDLAMCDMGAVGVQFRRPDDNRIWLAPIFSVNMEHHWRHYTKIFYTVLVNWVGSKTLLTEIIHRLPCGITAKNRYLDSVKEECYSLLQQPRDVSVCEHCGEQFEFYKYLFSEKNKYKHHVESHKLTCKKCGETFPNATVRIFHERTHRQNYVPCTKEGCKWVGRSDRSLQTHIRIFHTHELCDLCGKEFANSQSLALHMSSYHLPKKPNSWFCEVCGKGYSSKNILDKHVKRHFNQNSLVNKWMHDSPTEYKYECTKHNNCKKYFKTEAQFKRHMRTFATRDYPTKCATQYRPDIDPCGQNFIRDVPLSMEELQAKPILKKKLKKRKELRMEGDGDEMPKLKRIKKKKRRRHSGGSESEDGHHMAGPSDGPMVRHPEFVKDPVTEALKPAFVNHQYIPGNGTPVPTVVNPKGEPGESLSRSSSVAPNPPSAVQSPEMVHRVHEEMGMDDEMKEEPDEHPQMHYRTPPPAIPLTSRSHQIFHHLQQQASHAQHQGYLQQQHHHQSQHHDPNLPHWMAMAHHALYNSGGQGGSGSGR